MFAGQLKAEIEKTIDSTAVVAPRIGPLARLARWLRALWSSSSTAGASPMSEQNKQLVLRFIEAMGSSDGAAAIPCLHPEAFPENRNSVVKGKSVSVRVVIRGGRNSKKKK